MRKNNLLVLSYQTFSDSFGCIWSRIPTHFGNGAVVGEGDTDEEEDEDADLVGADSH